MCNTEEGNRGLIERVAQCPLASLTEVTCYNALLSFSECSPTARFVTMEVL
jgi:hypothetical protein